MIDLSPYSKTDRDRWRQTILAKGQEVSAKLEEQLSTGGDLQERHRRFFDHLMQRLRVIDHPRFGFDPRRGAFWSVRELDLEPWADLEP